MILVNRAKAMTTLSINKAAQLFKRSRNTIKTMLKDGRLSYAPDGSSIDFSELLRVFGAVPDQATEQPDRTSKTIEIDHARPAENNSQKDLEIRMMRELLEEKDKRIEDLQKAMLMLADKTPKKRWWQS